MPFLDCTGVLLAGGRSRRFGANKALADLHGCRLIEHPARVLERLFPHRLLVTNTPELYQFLGWTMLPDLHPGAGPLAGIEAALTRAATPAIFVAACDMPHLAPALIGHLCSLAGDYDAVIPVTGKGREPLHGVYARSALATISAALAGGNHKILDVLDKLRIREVDEAEMLAVSATALASFRNVNTVDDLSDAMGTDGAGP